MELGPVDHRALAKLVLTDSHEVANRRPGPRSTVSSTGAAREERCTSPFPDHRLDREGIEVS